MTDSLVAFLFIIALASYLQALTGFALGIFALGGVIALDLSSLQTAALVINVLMVTNVVLALRNSWGAINAKLLTVTLIGIVPGTIGGVWLLQNLGDDYFLALQMLLGLLIIAAGVTMVIRPTPRSTLSPYHQFGLIGIFGGIFGGLYSIPGPPVVYLFYRQPLTVCDVRATLLAIFGVMSAFRLAIVGLQGEVSREAVYLSTLSVPVVVAASVFFALYPPSVSDALVRRIAFFLLTGMGVIIAATALL
ncbi:TSUP family transporter [Pseudomonas qingdaonensis]|uniref:Probable membrane transporter protein n=1 Tax=Pseudomonas qingdaonensis TaxID=2056231 RepID=A0ABX8DLN0_9PSED|nr:TSUP family transporter [Pseudomonas qingdaonensis]QVL17201.1 TSUP family transporter [Pseudomonas qingdaonensis]